MNERTVAVIIPSSGRQPELLRQAAATLARQTLRPREVVVLHPAHELPPDLISGNSFLRLTRIKSTAEDSLTERINAAITACASSYIVLMNDDVRLTDTCLAELLRVTEAHPRAGMVCGKLLRPDGKTIDSAGQMLTWSCHPVERGYGRPDRKQFERQEAVFGCCGALVLYRKTMLEDVALTPGEYLDSTYHMFYEDADISWRARVLGWQAWYTPAAVAFHHRGATVRESTPAVAFFARYQFAWLNERLQAQYVMNWLMTMIKNMPRGELWWRWLPIVGRGAALAVYCGVWARGVGGHLMRLRQHIAPAFARRRWLRQRLRGRASVRGTK